MSMSLSGRSSPRATEPNTAALRMPRARKAGSASFNLAMTSSRRMATPYQNQALHSSVDPNGKPQHHAPVFREAPHAGPEPSSIRDPQPRPRLRPSDGGRPRAPLRGVGADHPQGPQRP